ncbi:nuclear pore complex protein Nup88 [Cimex lectularius]|uniref:Nuclear pore complex protein Nup88 n=1 Tax=Cimex lectularius TaxID=79782 RepID=A0A8I6RAX9_CIMLE|nr:nuclear pore complex protein Nup88 [Cimex lectularius]
MSLEVSILSQHDLFKNWAPVASRPKFSRRLAYSLDRIFTWNPTENSVHVVNVKHCVRDKDLKTQVVFELTPKLLFEVEGLEPNPSCTLLCLSGKNGVAIVNLPERWSQAKSTVNFTSIGQRLFLGEQHQLRQVRWHPGSPSDSHLVILTSDECLRCYSVADGDMLWKCFLSKRAASWHSNIPGKVSLGDTPVDFDFGPPPFDEDLLQIKWPILVLWGHGDVYSVVSSLNKEKTSLDGPLRMFPPSDDNYGTDASSIIVLNSSPPIVVLSTCTGTLYHCLLMGSEEPEHKNDKSLYVIEGVELNVGITLWEDDDLVSTKIALMKDPVESSRYFCIHDGGIHSVMVPIVSKLYEFLNENDDDFGSYKISSSVDYLICTGLNSENSLKSSPILGCAFLDLSMTLLVLLQSGVLMNIKMLPKTIYSVEPLAVERSKSDSDGFLLMIENALNENGIMSVLPMVKLPDMTPQAWLEIVMRTSQHCRKVLKVHESVAAQIAERAGAIRAAVSTELIQIEKLVGERAKLQETAEQIAERYEELNEKQNNLISRIEDVMKTTYNQDPKLSQKEKETVNYLNSLSHKLTRHEKDLNRVRTMQKYQASVSKEVGSLLDNKDFYLDDTRTKAIRQELGALSTDINEVAHKVRDMWSCLRDSGVYK